MNVLFVDDDELLQQAAKIVFKNEFQLYPAKSFAEAASALEKNPIDACLVDINLGKDNGMDILKLVKKRFPDTPVIMMSGKNEASTIVECIQLGADDFIEKPFETDHLPLRLKKVIVDSKKNRVFKRSFEIANNKNQIIGTSENLLKAKSLVEKAGRMRILFHGETGVGKTPFAWYSNQVVAKEDSSPRPFEQVNCAGLSNEHFQDQLFGHKKGAFTGAISDKRGLVEIAVGGDLFLDEIGEMPLDTQALFLTFLDSQEYYRLGDDQKRKADVRILCGTNRDLKKMVAEGSFRKDLYSRISQVIVEIPALRHHASDIPALLENFILQFSGFAKPYTPELLDVLVKHTWEEGNVRELRDAVEYLCTMGRNCQVLGVEHLSHNIKPRESSTDFALSMEEIPTDWASIIKEQGLETCLSSVEKQILNHYYKTMSGNLDELSRLFRTSKPTLYRRLREHGISNQ